MFWIGEQEAILTLEEKVEFLYKKAKKDEKRQARRTYYKVTLFLLFIGYTYYSIVVFLPMMKEYMNIFLGANWSNGNVQNIDYGSIIKQITQPQQPWNNPSVQTEQPINFSGSSQTKRNSSVDELLKKHIIQ